MRWLAIDHIRATVLYVRAGNSSDRGNYFLARSQIEKAMSLLGKKASRPSLFEFDLRGAGIYSNLSIKDLAQASAERAKEKIVAYRKLTRYDRDYLLDYCDLIVAEVSESTSRPRLRLSADDYPAVHPRYRRSYPITWT